MAHALDKVLDAAIQLRDHKNAPIPYDEVMESSRVSIEVANALRGDN